MLIFASVLLLSSCKTPRTIIKAPLKEEGPEYLYSKLKENEFHYEWLALKFDAKYTENKGSTDFKGQIRARKDSVIWVSISPALGIELFRLIITNDSVKYVNRFNKEYFAGDYALVSRFLQIDIDFDILQSLLLGNDFQFYENNTFKADVDFPEYRLSTTGRHKIRKEAENLGTDPIILVQNIWLNPESFKITRIDVKQFMKDNRKLEAYYGEFDKVEKETYPASLNFNITAENPFSLRINYSKAVLNEPMTFPFSIPGNYKRIK